VLYHYKHVVCSACKENEDILQLVKIIGPVYVRDLQSFVIRFRFVRPIRDSIRIDGPIRNF